MYLSMYSCSREMNRALTWTKRSSVRANWKLRVIVV